MTRDGKEYRRNARMLNRNQRGRYLDDATRDQC